MFNQTPFNATAFNADDGGGVSVDATVTLTGFDVAIEFGNLVAFEFITDRGGFGKQDRVLEPIEHVYPVDAVVCLTGIEVGVECGKLSASGEVHIDATARLSGVAVGVVCGKLSARGDSVTSMTGFDVEVSSGAMKAKGIHNPTDEEILTIIMEAMVA